MLEYLGDLEPYIRILLKMLRVLSALREGSGKMSRQRSQTNEAKQVESETLKAVKEIRSFVKEMRQDYQNTKSAGSTQDGSSTQREKR